MIWLATALRVASAYWRILALAGGVALAALVARSALKSHDEGQRALGAQQAINQEVDHADAVAKSRMCVRRCRADGGMWDSAQGRCLVNRLPVDCR